MKDPTGFTLVELMVVIAIVAILLTIAVPSFEYVTTSNRMSTEIDSLLADLQYARSEAMKQGQTVTVCPSADGKRCDKSMSWKSGWVVFSDGNGDGMVNEDDSVLRIRQAFLGNDSFDSDNDMQSVTFNRAGFASSLTDTGTVTISLRDQGGNAQRTRCRQVTAVGLLTMSTHATSEACR